MTKREELVALAPCPFCGGDRLEGGGDDKFVGYRCLDCEAAGPNHYLTGKDWNTRAQASAPPPEREAVKLREALTTCREFIKGEPIENAVVCIGSMQSLGGMIDEALSSRDDGEAKSSDGSGVRQGGNDRSHGESLQQGPDTTNTTSTDNLPSRRNRDVGNVANPVAAPDRASRVAPGPSEAPSTIPADVLAMKEACKRAADDLSNEYFAKSRELMHKEGEGRAKAASDACDEVSAAISRIDVPDWKQDQAETSRLPRKPPAPAAEQGVTVSVKPLEWEQPDGPEGTAWLGHGTELCQYYIRFDTETASYWMPGERPSSEDDDSAEEFMALDEAKAAAQADYETRIKSALDTEAQGVAVSVEELASSLAKFVGWGNEAEAARALLDKYSIRSAMMTEGSK
jgi:hypothetical protein